MNRNLVRIGIVDDAQLLREGLSLILEDKELFKVVLNRNGYHPREKHICFRNIDVLLIDANTFLKNKEMIKTQKDKTNEKMKIIILTNKDAEINIIELVSHGAVGVLLKEMDVTKFIDAINKVMEGYYFIHPIIANLLINNQSNPFIEEGSIAQEKLLNMLTEREYEILKKLVNGESISDISRSLGISINTVQIHLGHLYSKLKVSSKTQAVVLAIRNKWVQLQ